MCCRNYLNVRPWIEWQTLKWMTLFSEIWSLMENGCIKMEGVFHKLMLSCLLLCPTWNSTTGDCPAPRDSVPVPGQHCQVRVQQHRWAFSGTALAQERPACQVIQAGQEPKPRGSAHQPAGTGGCRLLPVHCRQWTGDSMRHRQADGHREGRSAQRPSPSDCHAVLQHVCPAHLGEARAQLGPDHWLLRPLSASYRSASVHMPVHVHLSSACSFLLDISHLPRLWQCGVPVCDEQRHHRVSHQRTRPSYCLHVLCGGLFPHGRQPSVCARNSRDDGGRWVEKFNANCEPLIVCKYSQRS